MSLPMRRTRCCNIWHASKPACFQRCRTSVYASRTRQAFVIVLVPNQPQQLSQRGPGHCVPSLRGSSRRAVCARASAPAQELVAKRDPTAPVPLLTFSEAQDVAATRGLALSVRELGPFYRITCRDGNHEGPIVGVSSGFTAGPLGLAHCDSLQVFATRLADRDNRSARERSAGLGLLMCGAVIAYCLEHGCKKAEILAINDDDFTHARLCKYYRRMGFTVVREVGANGLSDLPHQLVWGGVGTRMDTDTVSFLRRWSRSIRDRRT